MFKRILIALLIFLVAMEVLLRMTGAFEVYSEKIGGQYESYWGFEHEGHYKVLPFSQTMRYEQEEFNIEFQTNRFGMRDVDFPEVPPDTVFRILCLGDSYTEGDGAPWGQSFPRQLEGMLNRSGRSATFEVINAGKNGSDLLYMEKILTDFLYRLQPALVLIALNDSDIDDIVQRGGPGRFRKDGRTVYRRGPWYHPLYRRSHVFRLLTHTVFLQDRLFLGPFNRDVEKQKAADIMAESMRRLAAFQGKTGIPVWFIYHPLPWHVNPNRIRCLENRDVMECFRKTSDLARIDADHPGAVFNLYPAMVDSLSDLPYTEYAWPVNGHYNARGYRVMAGTIYEAISDYLPR